MIWRRFRVEIPKGSFLKRDGNRVEYLSPFPCPFNYGSIEGEIAADGDPPDVLLMGARVPGGALREAPQVGRVLFWDDGVEDHKLVTSYQPLSISEKQRVERFFQFYAVARGILNRIQGKSGETRYERTEWEE